MSRKTKCCPCCHNSKISNEFGYDRRRKDGLSFYCKACRKKLRKQDADKTKHYNKQYRDNSSEYKVYKKHYDLYRLYGITLSEYNALWAEQKGRCAICGMPESALNRKLFVDHNHTTRNVRGLLCGKCNTAIGLLNDDSVLFAAALQYLTKAELKRLESSGV